MTKKVRRSILKKIFLDFEKEEVWLNSMCRKGYALCEVSKGYYYFETCEPGEYIYRIEFLKPETMNHTEKTTYIDFIKEMEIDHIASINRWQYFRRKAALGEFEIYSDLHSKIEHYKRINVIWYILAAIFIVPGFFAFSNLVLSNYVEVDNSNLLFNLIFFLIGLFFLKLALPLSKKIRGLKKDQKAYD